MTSRGRLAVLIYHRVLDRLDPLLPDEVTAERFNAQMRLIADAFAPLPLAEAVERLEQGSLPPQAVCVTFDDGYADNVDVALPILLRHGVPATFFIATGYLGNGVMWNDRVIHAIRCTSVYEMDLSFIGLGVRHCNSVMDRQVLVKDTLAALKYRPMGERDALVERFAAILNAPAPHTHMMGPEGVQLLDRAGMDIGGHTVRHPILARMEPDRARAEIAEGKAALEAIIGRRLRLFAYPNGKPVQDYGPEHVAMARSVGFDAAVSTAWGVASRGCDRYQLPRFTPWDRSTARFALRLQSGYRRTPARTA